MNKPQSAKELEAKHYDACRRDFFHMPAGIYLCGNSLGLCPKQAQENVNEEFTAWRELAVHAHTEAKHPWVSYHELLTDGLSRLVGGFHDEVVAMNGLTINLHLMLVSFYRPKGKRRKILVEHGLFPSDRYAIESHIRWHGMIPEEVLVFFEPRHHERILRDEDMQKTIAEHGDSLALVLLGQPNYLTGQAYDVEALARSTHDVGALLGLDLAHGIGNLPLKLNAWQIDFAVWCSYKYLNAGPGALAGAFVHRNHHGVALPRLEGWWGHHKPSRFDMPDRFVPIGGAETWQLSNPPIFQAASLRASLSVFDSVEQDARVARSRALTDYLEARLHGVGLGVITPKSRGAQLSVRVGDHAEAIANALAKRGVIVDVRPPDLIRMSPVALYNTFAEIDQAAEVMRDVLAR